MMVLPRLKSVALTRQSWRAPGILLAPG